jgi:hypothetical protein
MRILCTLLIAATGAATSHDAAGSLAVQPDGQGHGRSHIVLRVSSAVPNLRISPANTIPEASPRTTVDEYCRSLRYEKVPTTGLGREVARRGWHVTSEAQVNGHAVVAYVREFLPGTSTDMWRSQPEIEWRQSYPMRETCEPGSLWVSME